MKSADLNGPLLRSVSRSFYLTIRLLPKRLREPVGLAYLLARASDTIADSGTAPAADRREHLANFREMIRSRHTQRLAELQQAITSGHPGEAELITALPRCLEALTHLPEFDQAAIGSVMEKIIRGQTLDLERFGAPAERVIALPHAAALEEYTYLVAGCVGEFWTDLCNHHVRRYSTMPLHELRALGIDFGKGLQLVNILRDLPSDLRDGRCYLPADELYPAGAPPSRLLQSPAPAAPVFQRWHRRARALLGSGRRYIVAIRPARVRAGCFLPWQLGEQTLDLLEKKPPLETPERVKVPRSAVRTTLWRAVRVAFSNKPLE